MTKDETVDDGLVRRVVYSRFKNFPEYHDDLYQEGRLALLLMEYPRDDPFWNFNAFRWCTRCLWRHLFSLWGAYKQDGEQKFPTFTDLEEQNYGDEALFNRVLTEELLKPLSYKERELIVHYYMEEATAEECAELTMYRKSSVPNTISFIRKKILDYEASGKIPEKYAVKRVLDVKTGFYFKSAKAAAKMLHINLGTLRHYLNGNRKNPTTLVYA